MTAPVVQGYAYDNHSDQAGEHHGALTALLDTQTRWRIEELLDLPGKRCLEVAAGAGSVAVWLAEQVGPDGRVLATDLKPERIPSRPGLEIRQHDIVNGPALGEFDLVHARLLLNHLPARRQALHRMVESLRPGGVLLTEDFWPTPGDEIVAYGPDPVQAELVAQYQRLHLEILRSHGNDRNWSRDAPVSFVDEGLEDVRVTVHGSTWRGGSPGCRLLRAGLGQLRDEVIALGMSADELDQVAQALLDPRLLLRGHLVYLTSGRKPIG